MWLRSPIYVKKKNTKQKQEFLLQSSKPVSNENDEENEMPAPCKRSSILQLSTDRTVRLSRPKSLNDTWVTALEFQVGKSPSENS